MASISDIKVIGVLGAGQMGGGIAQVAAAAGFSVDLADVSLEFSEKAKHRMAAQLTKQVEKGKLSAEARDALLLRVRPHAGVAAFAKADWVIEAATENIGLKMKLMADLDAVMAPGATLATNTSSISVTKLAAATKRPDRVIGMHFMNPPPLMKLVEIVRAVQTSEETFQRTRALAETMGKTTTTSKDAPGFLVNRILIPMICEAAFALEQGVGTAEDIDVGAKLGLNHPMGPLELADLIGLDTVLAISEVLYSEFHDDKYRAPIVLKNLVAAGYFGKKSGRGFYTYDSAGQKGAHS